MQCTLCGGAMEFTGGGAYGRCLSCGNLFVNNGGELTPMVVVAPGETQEEAHARVFSAARNPPAAPPPPNPTAAIIRWSILALVLFIFASVGWFVWKTVSSVAVPTGTPAQRSPAKRGR